MTQTKSRRSDLIILISLSLFISLLGLVAIFNASVVEGFNIFNDKFHFVKQQFSWLVLGLTLFTTISFIPPIFFKKIAPRFLVVALLFMLLVLIPGVGLKIQGARRWISFGFVRFQPSELLKIGLILYLSTWLETPRHIKHFILLLCGCLGLIMFQPDLGTATIVASVGFGLFYLSGSSIKEILIFALILSTSLIVLILSSPYRLERVHTFLDPTSDPLGRSYHINQILLGIGSGNWFGVGLGRSRQKYSYLPEATTDSIFTIIGEETGFVGAVFVVVLLLALSLTAFKIALSLPTLHSRLLAGGVGLLIASQTFVNLASMVALVPLTGVPLPLISYGGSSLVTSFIALGILASATRHK